ncbi:inactive serine/threonine-protein kinase VRK3 isoform X2 [Sardina pilchardus]|uniref:inactive serine/threonine-protein kinase VRK3 isoform X2 n=1 Tax=Sardina pilchardus TaxID=27697 RepID=UPI002E0F6D95
MRVKAVMERMHFCPHCGTRLQPGFRFCPSCGVKLSGDSDPASPESVAYTDNNAEMDDTKKFEPCSPQIHSPARKTRQTAPNVKSHPVTPPSTDTKKFEPCSPQIHSPARKTRQTAHSVQSDPATPPSTGRRVFASPRKRKAIVQEDSEVCSASLLNTSPQTSSVVKGKSAKIMGAVHPLKEGVELNDQSGVKWKLMKLLHQNDNEITYKVLNGSVPSCLDQNYILRLAAKDGQIFTEQNFLQRAAKTVTVEKWVKRMKLDNLGMPTCLGFGLHDNYRFLVFEDMGQSLHSIIQSETKPLSQKVVLMLACRILDVLEFVHENEYTHADLHAENVYINSGSHPKAILSGFGRAFRFCPGGKHVEYREGSRAPHLGHHDFISLDVHLGAAPSRRSDLQSLGYCLIHWMTGALPWSSTTHKPNDIAAEKRRCLQDLSHLLHHCFGTEKVPGALQEYLCQVMNLTYSETPDYTQLKVGLRNGLQQMGVALEDPFDLHM